MCTFSTVFFCLFLFVLCLLIQACVCAFIVRHWLLKYVSRDEVKPKMLISLSKEEDFFLLLLADYSGIHSIQFQWFKCFESFPVSSYVFPGHSHSWGVVLGPKLQERRLLRRRGYWFPLTSPRFHSLSSYPWEAFKIYLII